IQSCTSMTLRKRHTSKGLKLMHPMQRGLAPAHMVWSCSILQGQFGSDTIRSTPVPVPQERLDRMDRSDLRARTAALVSMGLATGRTVMAVQVASRYAEEGVGLAAPEARRGLTMDYPG